MIMMLMMLMMLMIMIIEKISILPVSAGDRIGTTLYISGMPHEAIVAKTYTETRKAITGLRLATEGSAFFFSFGAKSKPELAG